MFETKLLAEGFSLIEKALAIFEQQDPNVEHCTKVSNQISDAIQCYRIIYDKKKRKSVQSSLDRFFRPIPSTSKQTSPQPSTSKQTSPQPSTSSFREEQQEEEEDPLQISGEGDEEEKETLEVSDDDDDDPDDPLPVL